MPGARGWGRRPTTARINPGSRFARDLVSCYVSQGGQVQDLAGKTSVSLAGNAFASAGSPFGTVLRVDGSGDYANCGDVTAHSNTSALTVDAWLFAKSYPHTFNMAVCKNQLAAPYSAFEFGENAGSIYGQLATATNSYQKLTFTRPPTGVWFHVALTFNGSAFRCYLNGLSIGAVTGLTGPTIAVTSALCLGTNLEFAGREWDGDIGDVRVWKRPFSAAEVWSLYDPRTRWDLYWVPSRRVYGFVSTPPPGGFLSRLTLLRAG